jgi:hypothetical protein
VPESLPDTPDTGPDGAEPDVAGDLPPQPDVADVAHPPDVPAELPLPDAADDVLTDGVADAADAPGPADAPDVPLQPDTPDVPRPVCEDDCKVAPPPTCEDGIMTSYGAPGACIDGACSWPTQTVTCDQGCDGNVCAGDPCEGVDCSTPPGPCFAAGSCSGGTCTFPYADGAACDDGRKCTTDDACASGTCAGRPVACGDPPQPKCLDEFTLVRYGVGECDPETGECAFPEEPASCGAGCVDGACVDAFVLLDRGFTPAGSVAMSAGDLVGACVAPGWVGGIATGGGLTLVGGFEP